MKLKLIGFGLIVFVMSLVFIFGAAEQQRPDDAIYIDFDSADGIEFIDCKFIGPNEPIEQTHLWGWGKIPKQNLCPHCGEVSYKRFCAECKKERGNLPFIGVYCPKCNPDGKYAGQTEDVTEICQDCGADRVWKYVYADWQISIIEDKE